MLVGCLQVEHEAAALEREGKLSEAVAYLRGLRDYMSSGDASKVCPPARVAARACAQSDTRWRRGVPRRTRVTRLCCAVRCALGHAFAAGLRVGDPFG